MKNTEEAAIMQCTARAARRLPCRSDAVYGMLCPAHYERAETTRVAAPLVVGCPAARWVQPVADRLEEILAAYPGQVEVIVHPYGRGLPVIPLDVKVSVTAELIGDLRRLLGPTAPIGVCEFT
jgi:hypothetical protein